MCFVRAVVQSRGAGQSRRIELLERRGERRDAGPVVDDSSAALRAVLWMSSKNPSVAVEGKSGSSRHRHE